MSSGGENTSGLFSFKNFQFVSLTVSPIDLIDFAYQITTLWSRPDAMFIEAVAHTLFSV